MGTLNLISLLGLFVMILLAWIFSSHKTKVNWRLVVIGVFAQAILAALFFQSQNWTFDRTFDSFESLTAAVEAGEVDQAAAEKIFVNAELPSGEFDTIKALVDSGTLSESQLQQELSNAGHSLAVPRFDNGVLFYAVNSIFESITSYVSEGSNFCFQSVSN